MNRTKHTRNGSAQTHRTNLIEEHKEQIKDGLNTPKQCIIYNTNNRLKELKYAAVIVARGLKTL